MVLAWLCPGIMAIERSIINDLQDQQRLNIPPALLNLARLCNLVILALVLVQASETSTTRWMAANDECRPLAI